MATITETTRRQTETDIRLWRVGLANGRAAAHNVRSLLQNWTHFEHAAYQPMKDPALQVRDFHPTHSVGKATKLQTLVVENEKPTQQAHKQLGT